MSTKKLRKSETKVASGLKNKNEGGQPGNKNAAKWTEETAMTLGNELIEWLCPKIGKNGKGNPVDGHAANLFYEEFLIIHKGLYRDLIRYLEKKYKSFSDLIKRAKEIQEIKLVKHGTAGNLNPGVTCFVLKNYHGMSDKVEHTGNEDAPLTFIFKGRKPTKK